MTPKQYKDIKKALQRFQDLIYFDVKQTTYKKMDRVVIARALASLQESNESSRKGKEISDCLDCPYR